jgi:xanthine dehydrogenase YagS FAD-binding subunit
MVPFAYTSVADPLAAVQRSAGSAGSMYVAGGTDLLQLLQEGVATPTELVDINPIGFDDVSVAVDGVRVGAMARLSDVADDPTIRERFPAVAEALHESASPQVRNMATVAGNLLQRTRCLYFRDVTTPATSGIRDPAARPWRARTASTRCSAARRSASPPIPAIPPWRWWRATRR